MKDNINNPAHYTFLGIEPLDVTQNNSLNFCQGNALKYLFRAGHKVNAVEDIKKAIFYIKRNKGHQHNPIALEEARQLWLNEDRRSFYGEITTKFIYSYFINPNEDSADDLIDELEHMLENKF